MQIHRDTALEWHELGVSVLPTRTNGTKAPAVDNWKGWQEVPQATRHVEALFNVNTDGLGVMTGAISGNLEMFELEGRAVKEGFLPRLEQAMADHALTDLWDKIDAGYCEVTPSGGLHWYYRVTGAAKPNTKLARRPSTPEELAEHKERERAKLDRIADPERRAERAAKIEVLTPEDVPQVLIETRGEGGFSVVAPSNGRTHPSGDPWKILTGTPATIPTITAEERDALYGIASTLNQMPQVPPGNAGGRTRSGRDRTKRTGRQGSSARTGDGVPPKGEQFHARPGDDFNARASWEEILEPYGWTIHHRDDDGTVYWTRPGKAPEEGASATTGRNEDDRLYVFSTSTEFQAEKPYTKFAAYALLEHDGDFQAAASALGAAGYGSPFRSSTAALNLCPC